jgi:PAS domain S-box-containing protein
METTSTYLQSVIDAIQAPTLVMGLDYSIAMANKAAQALAGNRDPVAEKMKCYEVFHHRYTPCRGDESEPCTLRQVLSRKAPVKISHNHFDGEGNTTVVEVYAAPVYNEAGELIQVIESHQDITQRKRAEEMLKRERDFVNAVLDTAGALVVVLDTQGRIVRFNRACEKTTGYAFEEVMHRPFWEIFLVPEEMGAVRAVFDDLRAGHFPSEFENYWLAKSGRRIRIAWSSTALLGDFGGVEYVIATGIDITERKRAEDALREARDELEQRVKDRTRTVEQRAAQIRHLAAELTQVEQRERRRLAQILHDELQQLLVAAKLNASALKQENPNGRQVQKTLDQIVDIMDQSIEISRSLTAELSPLILYVEPMSQVLDWLAAWMNEKYGLLVDVEADIQADPAYEEVRVLLYQAIRELLFNVVKHAGVKRATVRLRCRDEDRVELVVEDRGKGFDVTDGKAHCRGAGGYGLFSIRDRLELLGGGMELKSAPGQGTRVTICAPACREEGGDDDGPDPACR